MARVFIDCHMFSQLWFKEILPELVNSHSVTFVYSATNKLSVELSKVRQALNFYKLVAGLKGQSGKSRLDDAHDPTVNRHVEYLENNPAFIECECCDDSHIFAIVYSKPTKYVFSHDTRMAKCRDHINKSIDKKYCDFIIISQQSVYKAHRAQIHR